MTFSLRALRFVAFAALSAQSVFLAHAQEVTSSGSPQLTIYNQQFAIVRESLMLPLIDGTTRVTFTGATAHLEPDSVVLRDLTGKHTLTILEQNYEADPISADLLLSRYEGRNIDFAVPLPGGGERIVSGKIVRAPQGKARPDTSRNPDDYFPSTDPITEPLIEVEGKLRFVLPGTPLFPGLDSGTNLRPTLSWALQSASGGTTTAELAYLTTGLNWEAAYTLAINPQGETAEFSGVVTIENQSGHTWNAAKVELMAGEVNRVPSRASGYGGGSYGYAPRRAANVVEKPFDDYHLYSLSRPTTLKDRETKQIEWVRTPRVATTSGYVYDGAMLDSVRYDYLSGDEAITSRGYGTSSQSKVRIVREIRNTTENGLGIPLPQGKVRFYRSDAAGALQFLGESRIEHTPSSETLRLTTGSAFDLIGEHRQTAFFSNQAKRVMNETFEITVRNRKKTAATVQVIEQE